MTTANTIIRDALREIFVAEDEQPLEAVQMSGAIRYMNRMMATLNSNGIALGYTVITGPSDTVTVADGALDGIVTNLAIRLAPTYGYQVPQELAIAATDGMAAMRKIAVTVTPTSFPCTLPIGSGNEWSNSSTHNDKFYPCPDDTTLTEEGNNINLESGS
jgi:hypothetical protein